MLKTRLSGGAIVLGFNRAGFGGRGIFVYRDAIEPEFECLERFLVPGGVFLDIGANTGIYTIKAARYFSRAGGKVLAIEPFPDVLKVLEASIRANGFSNVRSRNFCASDHTGSGTLWRNFEKPNLFSLVQRDEKASSFPVQTVTVDDLVRQENLDRVDYVKIDVEGAEREVLEGAKRTIDTFRPIVQVEVSIRDVPAGLKGYSAFQASGSPNKVLIPADHPKIDVPGQLGWSQVLD